MRSKLGGVDTSILHHVPTVIYDVFIHNNAFWSNSNAFSLLICKVYMKRENAGSWNSGLDKEQILETYSAQLQKYRNFTEHVFEYIKNIERKKFTRGPHPTHEGEGRALPPGCAPYLVAP